MLLQLSRDRKIARESEGEIAAQKESEKGSKMGRRDARRSSQPLNKKIVPPVSYFSVPSVFLSLSFPPIRLLSFHLSPGAQPRVISHLPYSHYRHSSFNKRHTHSNTYKGGAVHCCPSTFTHLSFTGRRKFHPTHRGTPPLASLSFPSN